MRESPPTPARDRRRRAAPSGSSSATPCPTGSTSTRTVLARADPGEPDGQVSGGPMFYTSGTTGFPKGVRSGLTATGHDLSLVDLIAQAAVGMLGIPGDGVTLLEGPAYHSGAVGALGVPLLGAASTVVMRHSFDAAELLDLVDRHGVTNMHLVPTQFIRLLKLPDDVRAGSTAARWWRWSTGRPPARSRSSSGCSTGGARPSPSTTAAPRAGS